MQLNVDLKTIEFFIVFVVPGLVSISVYRLLMPARRLDWSSALPQGLFYSSINFVVLLPLIAFAGSESFREQHGFLSWIAIAIVLLLFPAAWPAILRAAFRWKWLASRIQIPYPTAWDFFFDIRDPAFVLVHLNSGSLIGGYWGGKSYAGSFPNDGDIYLEAVYEVDENGEFGGPMPHTKGVLLRKEEYTYLELFDVPAGNLGVDHAKRESEPINQWPGKVQP